MNYDNKEEGCPKFWMIQNTKTEGFLIDNRILFTMDFQKGFWKVNQDGIRVNIIVFPKLI